MITGSNILICTDFSPCSDLALKFAETLKEKAKAKLHVLHVCEYPVLWDWSLNETMSNYLGEKFEVDLINLSKKKLDQQMHNQKIQGEGHITLGFPYQAIHKFIRENNISMLVMGHKGSHGSPFLMGGLAIRMIASSPVPILVVKNKMWMTRIAGLVDSNSPMKDLVSVTEELSSILSCPAEFLSLFTDIAARYIGIGKLGFSPKLLTLDEHQRDQVIKLIKDRIRKELAPNSKASIKVEVTIEKKLAYHLNSVLAGDHTDLAVMKRHQMGFLEKVLIGSETRRMAELYDGNLLILPP